MMKWIGSVGIVCAAATGVWAAEHKVEIRFRAMVGTERLACGASYEGVGLTKSKITPRDFRFYVSNVRLISAAGKEVPVQLEQDNKWQLDDVALLDFENGKGGCSNGTPELNESIRGTVPEGEYRGLRFTMGVPFHKNHQDLTAQPPPLNLTALFWAWNAGHKFARLDFSSTGQPRGVPVHLGSTGCTPSTTRTTIPTVCSEPNRPEVEFAAYQGSTDVVVADLGDLLKRFDADQNGAGCMSAPDDESCGPLFAGFGLPFGGKPAPVQTFFRLAPYAP